MIQWLQLAALVLTFRVMGTHAKPMALQTRATCTPASAGNAGVDDVPAIEAAFKSCGNGGIIVIPAGKTYAIRSTLDFTGCK
jgi:galacturan 1,4-alpha-galacturonidase